MKVYSTAGGAALGQTHTDMDVVVCFVHRAWFPRIWLRSVQTFSRVWRHNRVEAATNALEKWGVGKVNKHWQQSPPPHPRPLPPLHGLRSPITPASLRRKTRSKITATGQSCPGSHSSSGWEPLHVSFAAKQPWQEPSWPGLCTWIDTDAASREMIREWKFNPIYSTCCLQLGPDTK